MVSGHVDASDVIGAIFGQLEGLLGPELELKDLQKSGKISRINVRLWPDGERMRGIIQLHSGLDKIRTALIAAALETVDKVGPYSASVSIKRISDEREEKRKRIAKRAVQLLREWRSRSAEEFRGLVDRVMQEIAKEEVSYYGPDRLPAAPGVDKAEEIIVVEGRADVINMMRYGWNNVISIGGAVEKIPRTLVKLIAEREATAFVDGDRGGELVLRALLEQTDVDYVAVAPPGKSVQDLTAKEIRKALSSAEPADEVRARLGIPVRRKPSRGEKPQQEAAPIPSRIPKGLRELYEESRRAGVAILADEDLRPLARIPVSDLYEELDRVSGARVLVYSGNLTQRIVDKAFRVGLRILVADRMYEVARIPAGLRIFTLE
ncbi:MAG: DNA primase [Thermoproteota archaeon]|nr:MAG: DNA primase [Candidatus Korarchaeota archaeon]